jgi:hypothetical protein
VASLSRNLLTLEQYYPGGWWLAWRGAGRSLRGRVTVERGLLEAVAHGFYPRTDTDTDSLVVSEDWTGLRFAAAGGGGGWKGLEIRMSEPSSAKLAVWGGLAAAAAGPQLAPVRLPATVTPDETRVSRLDLPALFRRAETENLNLVVFWIEPGTEPVARAQQDTELRKQLKALGYLE